MTASTLTKTVTAAAFLAVTTGFISSPAMATDYNVDRTYRVRITNISHGNVFTPILAATHKKNVRLFKLGDPASEQLATLAESGNTGPLDTLLKSLPNRVADTHDTGAPLPHYQSIEFEISTRRGVRFFSMAAMILPTNDSFVSLDAVMLPTWGSRTFYAKGYDAGSEFNDESCDHIPGPVACEMRGAGDSAPADTDEGAVHISNGINGVGDLGAGAYDWRNPMAEVMITRVR